MHSFRSTLDFDLDHTQLKFKKVTHLPCPRYVCGVIKRQTFATRIFKTKCMSFVGNNKK